MAVTAWASIAAGQPYTVVGTGQTKCYDNRREIAPPNPGEPFYGQDAQYPGIPPSYRDNGDETVSDLNTGLMWVKARGEKMPWEAAVLRGRDCSFHRRCVEEDGAPSQQRPTRPARMTKRK